jgi:NAD(P)-dependent dehydrogenase (short-subunit alcohol dehydrogenase family)
MDVEGKVVVVTGGGAGIGRALCQRFAQAGASKVVAVDLNGAAAAETAKLVGGASFETDVASESAVAKVVAETEERFGPIALFCSNAGVATMDPDMGNAASAPEALWQRDWNINVMAHVHAARALIPRMKQRGGGDCLNTVSAAGLLSQIGSAIYSTTKHAAIGFAEALAITHRDDNIRISVLCPQGVDTAMLRGTGPSPATVDGVLSPEAVADIVLEGIRAEHFLILPHETVRTYMQRKTADYDRWLGGMVKLRRTILAAREKG